MPKKAQNPKKPVNKQPGKTRKKPKKQETKPQNPRKSQKSFERQKKQ